MTEITQLIDDQVQRLQLALCTESYTDLSVYACKQVLLCFFKYLYDDERIAYDNECIRKTMRGQDKQSYWMLKQVCINYFQPYPCQLIAGMDRCLIPSYDVHSNKFIIGCENSLGRGCLGDYHFNPLAGMQLIIGPIVLDNKVQYSHCLALLIKQSRQFMQYFLAQYCYYQLDIIIQVPQHECSILGDVPLLGLDAHLGSQDTVTSVCEVWHDVIKQCAMAAA